MCELEELSIDIETCILPQLTGNDSWLPDSGTEKSKQLTDDENNP